MKKKKRFEEHFIRRMGSLVLAVVMMCTSTTTVKASDYIPVREETEAAEEKAIGILNGSFEEEIVVSSAAGEANGWVADDAQILSRKDAYTGTYSGMLSKENQKFSQKLTNLVKGMTYTVDFMAKTTREEEVSAVVTVTGHGGEARKQLIQSEDWQAYNLDFTYTGGEETTLTFAMEEAFGETVFIDDVVLSSKGEIQHMEAENGIIRLFYNKEDMEALKKGDFSLAASVNGGEYKEVTLTGNELGEEEGSLTFVPIEKNHTIRV